MFNLAPSGRMRFWTLIAVLILAAIIIFPSFSSISAQTTEELRQRVKELEKELSQARAKLQKAEQEEKDTQAEQEVEETPAELEQVEAKVEETKPRWEELEIGPLRIGGAIRANYVLGDYTTDPDGNEIGGPSRGGHGGNFELDTFRINLDLDYKQWLGKAEYRWYNGYNFLHTGWIGYDFLDNSQLQAGVNRVPFGPGPYGISQSWLFDQHYYVGLSDDMDLGIKYIKHLGDMTLDMAYYAMDEGHWRGDSEDSARYSYDVVDPANDGYKERNQFNFRAIYGIREAKLPTELGFSAQYGMLESQGPQDDGDHYALSAHMVNIFKKITLASQFTYYKYDIDPYRVQSGAVTDDLIDMGAYDFAWPVAAEAYVAGTSLSYYWETPGIPWLEYIIPYLEYSGIFKEKDEFNDSEMFIIGSAFSHGGWYIYTDMAFSNGNFFVGGDEFTNFGANDNDKWQKRFNINFGYYF